LEPGSRPPSDDLTRSHYILSAGNRTDLPVIGDVDLHFTINGQKFVANVCILPAIDKLLLESGWLVENKCKWNFAEGTICAGNWLIYLHRKEANDVCCHILVTENCVVPPRHEANIPVLFEC